LVPNLLWTRRLPEYFARQPIQPFRHEKTTQTTPSKPRTPAKKPALPVVKAVKKPAAKVVKKAVAAPKPSRTVSKSVRAVKKTVPKAVTTSISAEYDVGFGNALFLRGEGPGLSWEKGVLMNCVADTTWSITLAETSGPVPFKFLINDEQWSLGEDCTLAAGKSAKFTPTF